MVEAADLGAGPGWTVDKDGEPPGRLELEASLGWRRTQGKDDSAHCDAQWESRQRSEADDRFRSPISAQESNVWYG